jgi:hypothetical protein
MTEEMEMDDVERSISPTIVTYGGTVIARLEAGQIATLTCARKRMKTDVRVLAGSGSGGKPMSVKAGVVGVVSSKINLDLALSTSAGVVDVITANVSLKMPIITTNVTVEET